MTKEYSNSTPFDAPLILWESQAEDALKEAQSIEQVNQQFHITLPHRKAEEIVGVTFVIVTLKEFESSYVEQDHAYFCGCIALDGEKFTVVLGGTAIVDFLDKFTAIDTRKPLKVTLGFVKQGKYGGYYTIS